MGLNDFLKKLFGDKSSKDMKLIQPWVDKVKAAYPEVERLTNDELRARTQAIMDDMQQSVKADRERIQELKDTVETLEVEKREAVWNEIDKLKKHVYDTFEAKLSDYLPEVFAIVKNTGYRFANNETIEVTATQMDRDLAATRDFVTIEGDKAIYKSSWMAGGNLIKWDMVHYDVQLFGGTVLHQGKIAEMATGEGKTLVATLPVFLNAMTHNGVHVVTVNDYLAKRDCEWMGPIYQFHGLTVDCIDRYQPNSDDRRRAYNCDITFGTNNEFGFDYLRDNMASHPEDLVQREHNFAIVDEVDSVLIDDARTPLIISGPVPRVTGNTDEQLYQEFRDRVERVVQMQKTLANQLLNEAKKKLQSEDKQTKDEGATQLYRAYRAWPKNSALIKYLSEPGIKQEMLRAEAFYLQDNQRQMHIALEPLYFAIEEKNKQVDLTDKGIEELTGAAEDAKFFVLPDVGSEMAEIEKLDIPNEEKMMRKDQLMMDYTTKAERVHAVDQLLKAYTMFDKDVDYVISDDGKVKIVDEQTGRIMEGRRWSDGLHQAVEAKERVRVEATTQTFATITLQNYFRMYHKLAGMTGTAETEAGEFWDIYKLDVVSIPTNRPVTREDMNDRVYKTKRAKYKAVIAQIEEYSRAGRPVLVGTTSVEISEQLSKMLQLRGIKHNVLNAKLHQKEADIVALAGQSTLGKYVEIDANGNKVEKEGMLGAVTIATNMAGRGTDIKLSDAVKAAGGLAIIGTERHESRRVDRQLRGRSGRQGDPGSSVFFVSLEDNLMRIFGSDRISKVMDSKMFGMGEDDVIEHPWLNKSIETAQKKVEENNFGIRKRLLEYDDVLNKQREVVYAQRRHALMGERIGIDFMNMTYNVANSLATQLTQTTDYDQFHQDVMRVFGIEPPFAENEVKRFDADQMSDKIYDAAMDKFNRHADKMAEVLGPQLTQLWERVQAEGRKVANVMIPMTDGRRLYQIPCSLEEAARTNGKNIMKNFLKAIMLNNIDDVWKTNLRDLDDLKQNTQNAHYEQKDPLLIYKLESYRIFERMVMSLNTRTVSTMMRAQIYIPQQTPEQQAAAEAAAQQRAAAAQAAAQDVAAKQQEFKEAEPQKRQDFSQMQATHAGTSSATEVQRKQLNDTPHVGRNEPCPCGSGLKYKNCHGKGL